MSKSLDNYYGADFGLHHQFRRRRMGPYYTISTVQPKLTLLDSLTFLQCLLDYSAL
jgi:hypothetical protein